MNLNFESIEAVLGGVAKALGYVAAAGGVYVTLGLPIPATVDYVDSKIAIVANGLRDIKVIVLEGQLRDINSQRNFLANEKTTLTRTLDKVDEAAQTIIRRRLAEIENTLRLLDIQEDAIVKTLTEARTS